MLKFYTETLKPSLFKTQQRSLLEHCAELFYVFEMATNQQRTADTISWWKKKFM